MTFHESKENLSYLINQATTTKNLINKLPFKQNEIDKDFLNIEEKKDKEIKIESKINHEDDWDMLFQKISDFNPKI